jgi:hypothetical protein
MANLGHRSVDGLPSGFHAFSKLSGDVSIALRATSP